MTQPLSVIEPFSFRGHDYFVKRDELIDPLLSGNKYRKLYKLIQTPAGRYRGLISHGGTQSNAMLSIAALCSQKGWSFHYTCKPVAEHIKRKPTGNLKLALELGMQLHEVAQDGYEQAVAALRSQQDVSLLFLPQGGADPIARHGINVLAEEIRQWQQEQGIDRLNLVTPSGTGTTAYYLATALSDSTIVTTPVVGNREYLKQQMQMLGALPENLRIIESSRTFHFAKPYPELLAIYQALKTAGIAFDLIYGAKMWYTLLQHLDHLDGPILYIHSGGLIGNQTMLDRYRHKGMG